VLLVLARADVLYFTCTDRNVWMCTPV
jgi:hypothetical protein